MTIVSTPLEKEMVTHSNMLAWKIPWTEEPGGLQSRGSKKNQTHNLETKQFYLLLGKNHLEEMEQPS